MTTNELIAKLQELVRTEPSAGDKEVWCLGSQNENGWGLVDAVEHRKDCVELY
jgi:hypothetical protein